MFYHLLFSSDLDDFLDKINFDIGNIQAEGGNVW